MVFDGSLQVMNVLLLSLGHDGHFTVLESRALKTRYTRAMRFFKTILAFALLSTAALVSTQAAPSSDGLYIGTLGSSQIVLKLETLAPEEVSATYYYRRIGRDIALDGSSRANGTFKLTEVSLPDREDFARLELTLRGANLSGTWTELKGKQRVYNVNLREAASSDFAVLKLPGTPALKKWMLENPLDALRFDAPLKSAKLETVAGKRVQWLMEPKSKTIFPSLPNASAAVKDALNVERYRVASVQLQCVVDDFSYGTQIKLYSNRLLSLSSSAESYCGGAHPDWFRDNYTLDLKTAKPLALEDLYRFTPVKMDVDPSSDGFTKYIEARAKVMQGLIIKKYGSLTENVGDECKAVYANDNGLSYLTWYLTPTGLVVQSSFAYVSRVCEDDFLLPYSSLMKYLVPNSPLR